MVDISCKHFYKIPTKLNFEEYQKLAGTTDISQKHGLPYYGLGLTGESGEVAEKIKKWMRGDRELDAEYKELIMFELGDALWYIAAICRYLGVRLEDVAQLNLDKLSHRLKTGTLKGDGDKR